MQDLTPFFGDAARRDRAEGEMQDLTPFFGHAVGVTEPKAKCKT